MSEVFANITILNYKALKDKYQAVDIDGIIEKKAKYYRLKPFKSKNKLIWIDQIKDYIEFYNEDYKEEPKKESEKKLKEIVGIDVFSRRGQIESFWNEHPFFYDKSKIFWLWNKREYKWELTDEIEFLNSIQEQLGVETIDSKTRTELIAGFQQIGRKHKPQEVSKYWVQYKDKIYDIKSGKEFEATPEYFVKNPIPHKVGESEETPKINKLLEEWVGEGNVKALKQIIAYSTSTDRFMQRVIALVGGGNNGKGTFLKLLYRFLGENNCVSSELKLISENQFEPAVIYGKLLVVFGEVSYDDLRNTNTLKQIAGEDKLRFCFKGKMPFTENNTALGICQTNSLPITRDKTIGFYRKWLIEDFPNQFKQVKGNLIGEIPEKEFENLARQSLIILKELYENPVFEYEGDFEERARRYEERSNPIMKFIEEKCVEGAGRNTTLREFTNACNEYLKEKHLRVLTAVQIGKILRDEGFSVGNRKIEDITSVVILNLKLLELSELSKSKINPHRETNEKLDSLDSLDSNPFENWSEKDKERLRKANDTQEGRE